MPFAVQRSVGGTLPFETVVLDFQRFIGAGCQVREVIGINEMDEIVLHDGVVGEQQGGRVRQGGDLMFRNHLEIRKVTGVVSHRHERGTGQIEKGDHVGLVGTHFAQKRYGAVVESEQLNGNCSKIPDIFGSFRVLVGEILLGELLVADVGIRERGIYRQQVTALLRLVILGRVVSAQDRLTGLGDEQFSVGDMPEFRCTAGREHLIFGYLVDMDGLVRVQCHLWAPLFALIFLLGIE